MKNSFTAVFLKTGTWYSAFALEIPGANTQGKTLKAARGNLKDAIKELFARSKFTNFHTPRCGVSRAAK